MIFALTLRPWTFRFFCPVASQFCLDLSIFAPIANNFRLDIAILCVRSYCHSRLDLAIFVPVARHSC